MFHVNPENGDSGVCRAKKGKCPFGGPGEHFSTLAEAQAYWESSNGLSTMEPALKKKTIVLSDIDGTLVRSSLVLTNAVDLHQSGDIDLGDTPDRWLADMKNEDLITELAVKYQKALAGKPKDFVQVDRTLNRMLSDDSNFFSTLNSIIEKKAEGAEVVLISGSPDYLIKPLADKYGFSYHGSVYYLDEDGNFTGTIDLMAGGDAKQKVIDSLNLEQYDEVVGIGDTASDGPLLKAAHRSILVAPTEETLEKLKEMEIRIDEIVFD